MEESKMSMESSSISTEKKRASSKALASEEPNPKRMETSVSAVSAVAVGVADPTSPMGASSFVDVTMAYSDHEIETSPDDGVGNEEEDKTSTEESKMSTESSSISTEKNIDFPKALAAEEPNPKRMETSMSVSVSAVAAGMADPTSSMRASGLVDVPMASLGSGLDNAEEASLDDAKKGYSDHEIETSSDDGTDNEENEPCCNGNIDVESSIEDFIDDSSVDQLIQKVSEDVELSGILNELMGTLCVDSQHTSSNQALKHFDRVKEFWGNRRFIEMLLKDDVMGYSLGTYMKRELLRLSANLMILIKNSPSCMDIVEENTMRSALTILIGYWSNEDMILPLVCTMGGCALGVKTKLCVVEEDKFPLTLEKECYDDEMFVDSEASDIVDIYELYNDVTIVKLAEDLESFRPAVRLADDYLMSLQGSDCYCYQVDHLNAAYAFWNSPIVLQKLTQELKQNSLLVDILTKYSKGAQLIRCKERMTQIMKDPELKSALGDRMRGALCILFSYWCDRDVTKVFRTLSAVRLQFPEFADVDLREEKIEAISYLTCSIKDMEGLKNWLACKYGSSKKFKHLPSKEIEYYLTEKNEAAKKLGYVEGNLASINLVLRNDDVFSLFLCWRHSRTRTKSLRERPLDQVPVCLMGRLQDDL